MKEDTDPPSSWLGSCASAPQPCQRRRLRPSAVPRSRPDPWLDGRTDGRTDGRMEGGALLRRPCPAGSSLPPLCVTAPLRAGSRPAPEAAGKAGREGGVKAAAGPCRVVPGRWSRVARAAAGSCTTRTAATCCGSGCCCATPRPRCAPRRACRCVRGRLAGPRGGLREPGVPAGSPSVAQEPHAPAAACGPVLQPVRPSRGGGPSADQARGSSSRRWWHFLYCGAQ